jgi:hypothetical protein
VTFRLQPHDLEKRDPARVLRGRVLDEAGRPVPEALVEPFGFATERGAQFGGLKGFDPLALTDRQGTFRLGVPKPGQAVYVQVRAPLLAPRNFARLAAGPRLHELTLFAGVTLTGRLVKEGKPPAGVAVGAVQEDRNVEGFVGESQAATDADGVFRLRNVPPDERLVLYGLMDGLRRYGALAARQVHTGKSTSVTNVGDLTVSAGHTLSGRVVLSDGKAVPAGTRVLLSREEAWDSQQAVADGQGGFTFTGLPSEVYHLSANVPSYRVSAHNRSFDLLNGLGLLGIVRADIHGLRLLLDPGPRGAAPRRFDQQSYTEYQRRRQAPLRGAPKEQDGTPSKP